jgi:hypothetical protein
LLELPTTKFSSSGSPGDDLPPSPGTPEHEQLVAKASQKYFKEVQVLVDDLHSTLNKTRDNHAVWMERYGRKIDRLPILNVDSDLLGWGASVASTFREMGVAERGANIRAGVRKSKVYGNYQYTYNGTGNVYVGGRWGGGIYGTTGYYNAISSGDQKVTIAKEENAKAKEVRFQSWKQVEDSMAGIRAEMTKRYGVEF